MASERGSGPAASPVEELSSAALGRIVDEAVEAFGVGGRRVLVVVPDRTRSGPHSTMCRLVSDALARGGAAAVTWIVALGTHRPLGADELEDHLGVRLDAAGRTPRGERVRNHAWEDPGDLLDFGVLEAELMAELSGGALDRPVAVRASAEVAAHDLSIVVGPVFPHEVVGFSGGNKYFFPGISGREMIDVSHWLGALITSRAIIGRLGPTPVRAMIDAAAGLLPIERRCLAMVVAPEAGAGGGGSGLAGLFAGSCEEAWAAAAALSSRLHIRRLAEPIRRVVAVMPERYEDMWTAAKGMYKLEPVVADGGEVLVLAPHIDRFSTVHGADLARVGYHCRDYFLGRWEQFAGVPLSVLAHSTHLRGQGVYDPVSGVESCRVTVRLATGIDEATCEAMGLAYADWRALDLEELGHDPETLVVPHAGETLYRLEGDEGPPGEVARTAAGWAEAAAGRTGTAGTVAGR